MAVLKIEEYRQMKGDDMLKVILRPTKVYPKGFFYCDANDEELVRSYTWFLYKQKHPYVVVTIGSSYSQQHLLFHQEKAYNILGYHPNYINHINGIEFDNINSNLDVVSQSQNLWCKVSRGYRFTGRSFLPRIKVNTQHILSKCVPTEAEACQSAYQLELQYEDYRYDFLKDRRKDTDILDLERTGKISEAEAVYCHVCRYAKDNAWYVYRYNLFDYFRDNHISVSAFSIDFDGFMTHPVTGQRLCPM